MIGQRGWDIVLRSDQYALLCRRMSLVSEADQARAIGVSASYLNRLLAGERHLNRFFIAGALQVLGCGFEDLFATRVREEAA
jgi:transcriptional regulator with XRE-family HTH domain